MEGKADQPPFSLKQQTSGKRKPENDLKK